MISTKQLSVYTIMFLISLCEKHSVIPLVDLRYIFYPYRSAMKLQHCGLYGTYGSEPVLFLGFVMNDKYR